MDKFLKDSHHEAKGLPALEPILKEWIAVQREYTRQMGDDFGWNYSERASTGFLAVAAWNAGGVALEEWHTEKGPKAKPRKGRCDLYIFRRGLSLHIEAKHLWSRATGKPENERRYIAKGLDEAVRDAKALQCPTKEKMGVLFLAPFYPVGKQGEMASHIGRWLKDVHSIPHSAMTWLFLDRKKLRSSSKDNVVPGIVLLARAAS